MSDYTGDGLIRVFTDRPPVLMSAVTCPVCGSALDIICHGFPGIPFFHRADGTGQDRGRVAADTCPVTSDDLAAEVARAQPLPATKERAA